MRTCGLLPLEKEQEIIQEGNKMRKSKILGTLAKAKEKVDSNDMEGAGQLLMNLGTQLMKTTRLPAVQVISTRRRGAAQALPNGHLMPTTLHPALHAMHFQDGIDADDVWDGTLQNLRPATSAELDTTIAARIKRFEVQQKLENKAATSPEPIPDDEIDRDLIWFNELETARPATKDEQAKIEYTKRRQSMFQGKMKNKVHSLMIGKLTIKPEYEELGVEECPWETYDICSPEYYGNPKRSYRYGQPSLSEFCNSYVDPIFQGDQAILDQKILFETFKKEKALFEDDIRFLLPVSEKIRALPDECGNSYNNDCMVWFKFWSEKSIMLYGKKAVIDVY